MTHSLTIPLSNSLYFFIFYRLLYIFLNPLNNLKGFHVDIDSFLDPNAWYNAWLYRIKIKLLRLNNHLRIKYDAIISLTLHLCIVEKERILNGNQPDLIDGKEWLECVEREVQCMI